MRARALVDLAGRPPEDGDVLAAQREAGARGSAAGVLDAMLVRGRDITALYRPKYGAPFHRLVALGDMGARARADAVPAAGALLDLCLDAFLADWDDQEVCVTGNLARAAIRMGRGEDPRVARALRWIVDAQKSDGGWHCFESDVGTLDAWEGLAALASVPTEARSPSMRAAIARGVEFFLERRLGVDDAYEPWRRLHWPRHYYYDALVGLEIVATLGALHDQRAAPALAWLDAKRSPDGRWPVERYHPDLAEGADYELRDAARVRPLVVDEAGVPSKWVTLAAMRVRKALQASA